MQRQTGFVRTRDGVSLYYEACGAGDDVVVVPNGTYLIDDLVPLARTRLMVFFDPRNRGRSDAVSGGSILQDVDDVRTVARHFSSGPVDIIGHSFAGLLAALVAKTCSDDVRRAVLIGPLAANPDREFPAPLINRDETFARVMRDLGALLPQRASYEAEAFCRKLWSALAPLYVTSSDDAWRIRWDRCELENERNALRYFNEVTLPSIRALALDTAAVQSITAPVLVVHGTKDRSAPYGGGREWALALPNARLLSVQGGGHAPWIEAPDIVVPAIQTFLDGAWPDGCERVESMSVDGDDQGRV